MDSNTRSQSELEASVAGAPAGLGGLPAGPQGLPEGPQGLPAGVEGLPVGPDGQPAGLEGLAAAVGEFAADDLDQLGDALLAAQVVAVQRLGDQLDADWLRRLAAVDARGAAGAEVGASAPSTAGWLRATTRMSPAGAGQRVRTARALHRGPLAATAAALAAGEVSYAHAAVLADATHDLPPKQVAEAEGVLVDAARRLDPARLHRLAGHLRDVLDPQGSEERGRAQLDRRGLWLAATFEGMVAVNGLLDPDAGEAARAALAPLAGPTGPDDERSAAQRRADALGELARQALQAGHLPDCGGLRPQLAVTVEFASLLAEQGGVGGWGGVLGGEAARRLACDAAVTRAVVHRHPTHPIHPIHATAHGGGGNSAADGGGLAGALRATIALLPPPLGAPVPAAGPGPRHPRRPPRAAPRPGGARRRLRRGRLRPPPPWTDAHHLHHWLHGGPTSLDNLVLLCRVHTRAVHEGGWQLHHDPASGQATLAPPARGPQHQRPPPAA